jgi:hypothetical protein
MYQDKRKFHACVFCGSSDRSKEHVFGSALSKALKLRNHWQAPEANGQVIKGSSPLTDIQPRMLCQVCNNSKFSPFMEHALPVLVNMAKGEQIADFREKKEFLRHYFESRAMLIDVLTSNHELDASKPEVREAIKNTPTGHREPVFTAAQRKQWREKREAPINLAIYLGLHNGVLGVLPYMQIASEPREPNHGYPGSVFAPDRALSKRIIFVLRRLAVYLDLGPQPCEPPPISYSLLGQLRDWPPPTPPVSYDDVFSLLMQGPEVVAMRMYLSVPENLKKAEGRTTAEYGPVAI